MQDDFVEREIDEQLEKHYGFSLINHVLRAGAFALAFITRKKTALKSDKTPTNNSTIQVAHPYATNQQEFVEDLMMHPIQNDQVQALPQVM